MEMDIIEHGLNDERQKVQTITALSLAEAAAPSGIESFDSVLKPLHGRMSGHTVVRSWLHS